MIHDKNGCFCKGICDQAVVGGSSVQTLRLLNFGEQLVSSHSFFTSGSEGCEFAFIFSSVRRTPLT